MSGFHSCCGFPHGSDSLYAMLLSIASFLFSISSTFGCYFAGVDFVFLNDEASKYRYTEGMTVGLFSYEDKRAAAALTCKMYSDTQIDTFDTPIKAARVFGVMANILIGLAMIFLILLSCTSAPKLAIAGVSVILFLGALFHALTFLIYSSDALCETCGFHFGSAVAILCVIITLMNSTITFYIATQVKDDEKEEDNRKTNSVEEDQPVEKEQITSSSEDSSNVIDCYYSHSVGTQDQEVETVTDDTYDQGGFRQIIKTIVNQDGTHTVEETTVVA